MTLQVYGVVGNPVAHSRSPPLHNAAFAAAGIDAVYLPLLVDDMQSFLAAFGDQEFGGFSVTIPHKVGDTAAIERLDGAALSAASVIVAPGAIVGETALGWAGAHNKTKSQHCRGAGGGAGSTCRAGYAGALALNPATRPCTPANTSLHCTVGGGAGSGGRGGPCGTADRRRQHAGAATRRLPVGVQHRLVRRHLRHRARHR